MIHYDFRRGLSQQECVDLLTSTSNHPKKLFIADLTNLIVTDRVKESHPKSAVSENVDAVHELIMQDVPFSVLVENGRVELCSLTPTIEI